MFAVNLRIAFAGEWFGAENISSLAEIAISMRPKADQPHITKLKIPSKLLPDKVTISLSKH